MTVLFISPDYASHYGPLAVLAGAVKATGRRVVVGTGPALRTRVEADGFEWRHLRLGSTSNGGIAARDPSIERFLAATRIGAVATIRRQALDREIDLLWQPEQVALDISALCDSIDPDEVVIDHVSFGSTLAMHATARSFITLVPGHPTQLPVGDERYGIPPYWPVALRPDPDELDQLKLLVDRVTAGFTRRWNDALARIAPERQRVDDAFRVHGRRVLYNSMPRSPAGSRSAPLPLDHRFVGPLVRDEALPDDYASWQSSSSERPRVYVALGSFLSHRGDVLATIADALRQAGARAAMATGATDVASMATIPDDWIVAPTLPQVALLRRADLAIHHGGNNSVQECIAAGTDQIVLPFSTDQFANAADLEAVSAATVLSPNDTTATELAEAVRARFASPRAAPVAPLSPEHLIETISN